MNSWYRLAGWIAVIVEREREKRWEEEEIVWLAIALFSV